MKTKRILILGGGVAGCSAAYFLKEKGHRVTIIEKNDYLGGMSRTHYYAGHPYEFGPHIWFWPDEKINNIIRKLTRNELFYIKRPLFSYIEKENTFYKYPIHFSDIEKMPDKLVILKQLAKNRDRNYQLIDKKMPALGYCSFKRYFVAALGKNLYDKFMKNYTWKMWGIPGEQLKTSMIWADRVKHKFEKIKGYDPLKFESHTLGKGIGFQVYPKKGWNVVWEAMAKGAKVNFGESVDKLYKKNDGYWLKTDRCQYRLKDYDALISTLSIDELWGKNDLPYTGRIIIPLLLPLTNALPRRIESIHYPGIEFQTRITEIKRITKHQDKNTLIIVEVPILSNAQNAFPKNVTLAKHYQLKAYPQQSADALAKYSAYVQKAKTIKNLFLLGRLSQFKYWGMAQTVDAAKHLVEANF